MQGGANWRKAKGLGLMIKIRHYLKDPKLREYWYVPYYGVMQDLYHQP